MGPCVCVRVCVCVYMLRAGANATFACTCSIPKSRKNENLFLFYKSTVLIVDSPPMPTNVSHQGLVSLKNPSLRNIFCYCPATPTKRFTFLKLSAISFKPRTHTTHTMCRSFCWNGVGSPNRGSDCHCHLRQVSMCMCVFVSEFLIHTHTHTHTHTQTHTHAGEDAYRAPYTRLLS
jgi:hypothetical protein